MYHRMTIAGLERDLPLCPVSNTLYIAAFVIFGDQELTVACARDLLARAPEYDYIITAEAKGIPLAHEMARQAGDAKYILARKGVKVYMRDVFSSTVRSITTAKEQTLYLDGNDAALMKGKRILIVADGESLGVLAVKEGGEPLVAEGATGHFGALAGGALPGRDVEILHVEVDAEGAAEVLDVAHVASGLCSTEVEIAVGGADVVAEGVEGKK